MLDCSFVRTLDFFSLHLSQALHTLLRMLPSPACESNGGVDCCVMSEGGELKDRGQCGS